jgi:hypothetical protein
MWFNRSQKYKTLFKLSETDQFRTSMRNTVPIQAYCALNTDRLQVEDVSIFNLPEKKVEILNTNGAAHLLLMQSSR